MEKFKALTTLSEDEQLFFDTVKDFAESEIAPFSAKMDADSKLDPSLSPKLFEMGLMGIEIPEKYLGSGSDFFMAILAIEAISMIDPAIGVVVDAQNTLVNNLVLNYGSDFLKSKYLPQLAAKKISSYALSEAVSGSDAFALTTRAEDKGDYWELTGNKLWITNGGDAELFVVFANANPAAGYKGITAFMVEKDSPGFSVGKKEDKLGIRASSTCELILDHCIVPNENMIGELGKGYKIAIETLNEGRIGIGAQMLGLAEGALNHGLRYIQERVQFGQKIGNFQGMQFQLADIATEVEAAKLMVYNAARLKMSGRNFIREAAMAKLYSSQIAEKTASLMVEFFGGYGFTKDYPVEKLYRDAKIGTIYEGTSNMQRLTIAKTLLKNL
ncbi:MAG TPA: acyl-CoA dehydrogenase [Candidatus Marinimicrobia bacterium]|nr:acyl-CoA dehydrogenase [Candidatus Neomarinimicrobiota bacterium]